MSLLPLLNLLATPARAGIDECVEAMPLVLDSSVAGNTTGAYSDDIATCATSTGGPGVWYRIDPAQSGTVTLSTCLDANFDTQISVYTGSCFSPSCLAGNDDFAGCGLTSQVEFAAIAGETYHVLVNGWSGDFGNFVLTSSFSADASNDTCDQPVVVSAPDSVVGETVSADADLAPVCGTGDGTGGGVWYSYTAPADGTFTASTCNATTDFDTKLRIYSNTCSGLECEGGADDDGACPFANTRSTVSIPVSEGTSYSILVHGFDASEGTFQLDTDFVEASDPVGDMVLWANTAYGSEVVTEASGNARLRPSRWQTQLNDSTAALADGGCTTSTVPQDWAAGVFDVRSRVIEGTGTLGPVAGTLNGGDTFTTTFGSAAAGEGFSAIAGGKGVADLNPGDFAAAHWVRITGRRGVFHAISGACDNVGTAPDALSSWFNGDLSGWP